MQTAKAIERRIEMLLAEAFRAGEQAKYILIRDQSSMSQFLALQKIEYAAALSAKHLRWALALPDPAVIDSSQQE